MTATDLREWAPLVGFFLGLLIMLAAAIYGSVVTSRMIKIVNLERPEDKKIPSFALGPFSEMYGVYDSYRKSKHGPLDKQVRAGWLMLAGGLTLSMLSMIVIYRM